MEQVGSNYWLQKRAVFLGCICLKPRVEAVFAGNLTGNTTFNPAIAVAMDVTTMSFTGTLDLKCGSCCRVAGVLLKGAVDMADISNKFVPLGIGPTR